MTDLSSKTETLRPCPFCGSTNLKVYGNTVECHDCDATGPDLGHCYDQSEAIRRWDQRATVETKGESDPLRTALQGVCAHSAVGSVVYQIAAKAIANSLAKATAPREMNGGPDRRDDELLRLRRQMGEIAVLLLQNDRDEVMEWARGVKLHFPDGSPELVAELPEKTSRKPGYMGDINGPGLDPDVP